MNSPRDRTARTAPFPGSSRNRLLVAGAAGACAILFFHPGAMDWDRIKWSLLLAAVLPASLLFLGRALAATALAPLSPALAAASLLPAFLFLSCLGKEPPSFEESRLALGLLLMLVLACAVRDGAWERPLLLPGILLAAGALAALYGIAESAGIEIFPIDNPNCEAISTLGNTNAAAEVFALLIPLAATGFLAKTAPYRALAAVSLVLLAGGLFASGGRGGLLAALAGLGAAGITAAFASRRPGLPAPRGKEKEGNEGPGPGRRGRRILPSRGIPAILLLLAAGVALAALAGKTREVPFKNIRTETSIYSPEYPTNKVRLLIWKSTLAMIRDHPLLGTGAGRFRTAFPRYRDPEEARIRGRLGAITEVENPHDEYLWAAAEGGIGACAALVLFLFLLFRQAVRASRIPGDSALVRQAPGLAGLFASFAVLALFRSPLHSAAGAAILFLAAGLVDATRYDAGPGRIPRTKFLLTGIAGLAAAALTLYGGRALVSDLLFAGVGTASRLTRAEYEKTERAFRIDDGNIDMVNFLGQVAARLARYESPSRGKKTAEAAPRREKYAAEAKRFLGLVLKRNPAHPGALWTLGRIRLLEGDAQGGRRMLRRALALRGSPENPDAAAAEVLEKAGRYAEAASFLVAASTREDPLVLKRGEKKLDEGEARCAALYADAWLAGHPLDVDALHLKARSLRKLGGGGEKDAFRLMQLAIALEWIASGDWDQAEKSARRSLVYGIGDGTARLLIAAAEAGRGKTVEKPDVAVRNAAIRKRLGELAADGDLPGAVRILFAGNAPPPGGEKKKNE